MITFLSLKPSPYLLISLVCLLSACTSKPREVHSSIPLVTSSEAKPAKKEVPDEFRSQLEDPSINSLTHQKYDISLSELYVSAMGYNCRELEISEKKDPALQNDANKGEPKRRVACEIPYKNKEDKLMKSWFLEKAIIESSSYVDL